MRANRVPICRLDVYAARHQLWRIDFVKIDVEGGERDALRGAEELFRRDRPVLMCEIEPARVTPWNAEPDLSVSFAPTTIASSWAIRSARTSQCPR